MQQPLYENRHNPLSFPTRQVVPLAVVGFATIILAFGCSGESNTVTGPKVKSFGGVALTVRCADPAFAASLSHATQSWATRSGATVTLLTSGMTPGDDSDLGILAAAELGMWADRGELTGVPASLRLADNSFQWSSVLPIYREQLSEWGGQAQAVPLAGDGSVIIYRTDRLADAKFVDAFRAAFDRKPTVPTTWEDFADLAIQFTRLDGKPSLPPMTSSEVADLFFRIAACYDRPAIGNPRSIREGILSLQFDVTTAEPRLNTPAFSAAGALFARLAAGKCFAPPVPEGKASDPVAALRDGTALAILSLAQLAHLPRENGMVPVRFGIAALPGTRQYHDPEKGMTSTAMPNYVPYFTGGRIGVVRTRCANAEAAFDLLADLGGPARSLELVSTPGLGVGPFRLAHLESERLPIWYGYALDAARTKQLQQAMQQYVRQDVKTPALGLRGPDQEALSAAAARELGQLVIGARPADVLKQLTAAWNEIDRKTLLETRLRWRKRAAGVN